MHAVACACIRLCVCMHVCVVPTGTWSWERFAYSIRTPPSDDVDDANGDGRRWPFVIRMLVGVCSASGDDCILPVGIRQLKGYRI